MAHEVVVLAFARGHAVVPEIAFRANFCALCSDPARLAATYAVVSSAHSIVQAFAVLAAVETKAALRARGGAAFSHPAWQALTFTSDMMAISIMFAATFFFAVFAKGPCRARMLTRQSNITRLTDILPGYVITSYVTRRNGANFFASNTVGPLITWCIAVVALPTAGTNTQPSVGVTGAVVLAVALLIAVGPKFTFWTAGFTFYTILWIAGGPILAHALLTAVHAVRLSIARSIAILPLPAWCAQTLASLC